MLTGSPSKEILHAAHSKEELYRIIKDQSRAGNYLTVGRAAENVHVAFWDFRTRMHVGDHAYSVLGA